MASCFVDQTTFYDPQKPGQGNCVQAAVASILGLPLEEVPNFIEKEGSVEFWRTFKSFLRDRGWEPIMLPGNYVPMCDYLASGKSERGCGHMVIMNDGQLVHDPHPSRKGIRNVDCIYLLAKRGSGYQTTR